MKRIPEGLIVVLEGGFVAAIVSHNKALIGTAVTVIDHDTEGSEIVIVEQAVGSFAVSSNAR